MRRFWFLAVLMVLSPPVYAGSFAFSIGGHRIHIESPRYCRSRSCASVSISGISQSRRDRVRYDDDNRDAVDPVKAPAPLPSPPPVQPAAIVPPPPPPAAPRVEKPAEAVRPATAALKVSHQLQHMEGEPADTPVGDWLTEAKGTVRIVKCGRALCGYVLNTSSDDKGEAVLVNMKPKTDTRWTGSVYSHDSGDIYYGTMDIKRPDTLRVEACALGRFYCSGNNWSRITARNEPMMSSRQTLPEPRS